MLRLFSSSDPPPGPSPDGDREQAAKRLIRTYARLAAVNSLNPIPGLDIGIDAGILTALHHSITSLYGLGKEPAPGSEKQSKPQDGCLSILPALTLRLFPSLTGTAVIAILRQLGAEFIGRETTKWLPLVGTAISATIGYQIVYRFGEKLLEECESAVRETPGVAQLSQAA